MALWGFAPYALIAVLYFESLLNSYALAMSVFSIAFVSASAMEIPMGVMSDFIGRRKTMILGALCCVAAVVFYIIPAHYREHTIFILFIGAFIQGTGQALISGTDEAIIYETAQALGDKYEFKKYYSRGRSFQQAALGISALLSGFIVYYTSYVYCYYVSLVSFGIWFIISFWWVEVETGDERDNGNNIFAHIKEAVKLFKSSRKLQYLSIANIIDDSSGLALHRFEITYYQILIPEYLYGVPRMIKQMFGAVSFALSSKVINKFTSAKTLLFSCVGMTIFKLISLIMNNFFTPFVAAVTNLFYGTTITAETDLLQKEFSDKQRATMRSLIGMCSSLMFGILAVAIGYVADLTSPRTTLFYFLSLKIIIFSIYWKIYKLK
jgi:MFS family permease